MIKATTYLHCPVLFLVFNRPSATRKVFETIRSAKPRKLYVAADGPRKDKDGESERSAAVRKIATNVDWDCDVKTLFREENLGCKAAVSGAITWFFQNEAEGIILEDDCVPNRTFFTFCEELLERYRDNDQIAMISGNNFQSGNNRTEHSYYFSRYTHIWGWATWRRSWQYWDGKLSTWPEMKKNGMLRKISEGNKALEKYWSSIFDYYYDGKIDTWDYPWLYSCWLNGKLSILPSVNLVSNIGFGEGATHTKITDVASNISREEMGDPLIHPYSIVRHKEADNYTEKHHYNIKEYTGIDNKYSKLITLKSIYTRWCKLLS